MRPYGRLIMLALRHPGAWLDLLGMSWAARRRGWWRRPPFLPIPPIDYLRWRNETAYGEAGTTGSDRDILAYLRWARHMRRRSRRAPNRRTG